MALECFASSRRREGHLSANLAGSWFLSSKAWPQFLMAVCEWLQASPDCFRNRIKFAVPLVTDYDLFRDKSGLRQVPVSLLLGRGEVEVDNYSHHMSKPGIHEVIHKSL